MKRPTMLVKAMLADASLDLDLSVERDVERVQHRCEHEGISFLTITLPTLSDALERGLECGAFTCPTSFSRHGSLPRFLGGFFKRVFTNDGRLLPNPSPRAIYWIRMISRFWKKQKIECLPRFKAKAIDSFLEVEGELRRMTPFVERKDDVLDKIAGILWSQVFPELDYADLVCHHGPGVTADRRLANARHRISKWNHRSELTFPSDLHCYPNFGVAAAGSKWEGTGSESGIDYLKVGDELPVRVVFVPKTQLAPRVIAIEPSHMQYMQQSVKDYVYKVLEGHPLTCRSIRFADQSVNQRLAYRSSIDKRLATLDLKDASDRVHLHLVQRIFKTSGLLHYLEDARSLHATLPNGRNIVLFKYASMGSALCFPVEAMVFYTLVQAAMHQLDGRRPSSRSIRAYSKSIDIYGDDIIVPVEYTDVVVRYLESYALKVNVNKSFRFSNFRESCGADFFNGEAVNPVYARKELRDNLRHWGAEEIMSWNATADLLYMRGHWKSCQFIRSLLSRVVRRTIPRTRYLGSGLAHFSYLYTTHLRWNGDLQGWKQKRLHFDPVKRKDLIDGDELACLNKWGISIHANRRGSESRTSSHSSKRGCDIPRLPGDSEYADGVERSASGVGYFHGHSGPRISNSSVREVQELLHTDGTTIPSVQSVPGLSVAAGAECVGSGDSTRWEASADYCLTEAVQSDPLAFLAGTSEGLDFSSSTKRGAFKSKHRWVSLLS